jgi:tripartite ATP-independent transporter DctM subunit
LSPSPPSSCFFSGVSVALGLLIVSAGFLIVFDGMRSLELMPEILFGKLDNFALLSIPMFIIMGASIASTRAGADLYEALERWLTRVPGGLVVSNLGACALFAAMSGSSPATCAAIGKMGIPEMRKRGYPDGVAAGSIAAGGTLGILIPPSVTMIVYGIATETSIGRLFLAGVIPGLLLVGLFMAWSLYSTWRSGDAAVLGSGSYTWSQKFEILPRVLPFLAIILGVLYAMYGGVATPSETAAVGALMCLLIAMIIYKLWNPADLWVVLRDSTKESVMILFIIAAAGVFSYMLSSLFITQSIAAWIGDAGREPLGPDGRRQRVPADRRLLPAAGRRDPDGRADPAADHHHGRVRPDLVRGRADHQHGNRSDFAAGRPQSLRDQRHRAGYLAEDHPDRLTAVRGMHGDRDHPALPLSGTGHVAAGHGDGGGSMTLLADLLSTVFERRYRAFSGAARDNRPRCRT